MIDRARAVAPSEEGLELELPRLRTPLQRLLAVLRRHALMSGGLLALGGYLTGAFAPPLSGLAAAALVASLLMVAAAVLWRWRRASRGERVPVRLELAVGVSLLALACVLVQATGESHSPLGPLRYLLAAFFAVTALPRRMAIALLLLCALSGMGRAAVAGSLWLEWPELVVQAGFTLFFALLYHLLLGARVWAARAVESVAVERRMEEAERNARALRLAGVPERGGADDADETARHLLLGSMLELEQATGGVVEGVQRALGGHAVALFWLDDEAGGLMLRVGRSRSGVLASGPLPPEDGLPGVVLRSGRSLVESGKVAGVNWYQRALPVRSVCAVPVVERSSAGVATVRGVLLCDRMESEPFSEREQQMLVDAAVQVERAVAAERLVGELHRAQETQRLLQQANEQLARAADPDDVARTCARLVLERVSGATLAAVVLPETLDGRAMLRVVAEGESAAEVDGLVYDDNDGLVAQAVRSGAAQPARAGGLLEPVLLFDRRELVTGGLRALPLGSRGRTLAALVVRWRDRGAWDADTRRRMDALLPLATGALQRAQAVARLAVLTRLDPLTGLSNRHHFEQLAAGLLQSATAGVPTALMVVELDQQPQLSTVHGGAGEDELVRALAAVVQGALAPSDLAGRWGGGRLVLLVPGCDGYAALGRGSRLCEQVGAAPFETRRGPVRVTVSVGATLVPAGGASLEELLYAAEGALDQAHRDGGGRPLLVDARTGQPLQPR